MRDDELQQRLRHLKVPEASEAARRRARHRALIAFQQRGSAQSEKVMLTKGDWSWPALIALGLMLGFLPFLFLKHPAASENLAADWQILQQVQKLFPDQVNAVVEQNGKVDLSIAQSPEVGSDQPVLVEFKRGHDSIRVLSYSGHRICLMLGKTQNCFDILATTTGGVILEGEDKVWLASEHPHVAGYSIQAQSLKAAL